jgi:hypothetical protein
MGDGSLCWQVASDTVRTCTLVRHTSASIPAKVCRAVADERRPLLIDQTSAKAQPAAG